MGGYPKPRVMWLLNGHTVINGSKHKLVYDGMWHFDIPKCRDIDAGKVEVIARNSCGEAYASTTLTVNPRQDDYRAVLKHNVKRDYINSKEYIYCYWYLNGILRFAQFSFSFFKCLFSLKHIHLTESFYKLWHFGFHCKVPF